MVDHELVHLNVEKTQAVERRLRELGESDPELLGRLGADLGDLYAGAERYQRLIDALVTVPVNDRERLGDVLADLYEELRHLGHHIDSSLEPVDALAERFD
jgi:hypothetical protein